LTARILTTGLRNPEILRRPEIGKMQICE